MNWRAILLQVNIILLYIWIVVLTCITLHVTFSLDCLPCQNHQFFLFLAHLWNDLARVFIKSRVHIPHNHQDPHEKGIVYLMT